MAVKFVYDYLASRKQRTKISDTYSSSQEILSGVIQGSILGPLLFNIDIWDLFFIIEDCDIANYVDDNTPYLSGKNVEEVLNGLENVSSNLFQWFTQSQLKGNASKCHLLISSGENVHVNIGTSQIKNSDCERLVVIDIDCKFSFENHINQICSKARAKIKALARKTPFLNKRKRKLLMNAFFKWQFSYYPLSWMFHSRTLNNKINRLHERCLCIIDNYDTSSFTDLLENDNLVSVHHRNIQVLATELYKFVNGPTLVTDRFKLNKMTAYNTRNRSTFYARPVCTVLHGIESLSYLEPDIRELVPSDMKNLSTFTAFKKAIKQWKPHAYPCRLCRTYIYQVGFV